MARIAAEHSDVVVFTSDNPRSEDPEAIIADMMEGLDDQDRERAVTVVDRREAIRYAVDQAGPGDVVLIAGKGHETYQEIKGVRYDFDDREVARQALRARARQK
jgi:UDP-N-acetylmuramoyl-L-alanyl-D-glutamate--2,6-diaminopimelate ligase